MQGRFNLRYVFCHFYLLVDAYLQLLIHNGGLGITHALPNDIDGCKGFDKCTQNIYLRNLLLNIFVYFLIV